jgi:hypothetical protein
MENSVSITSTDIDNSLSAASTDMDNILSPASTNSIPSRTYATDSSDPCIYSLILLIFHRYKFILSTIKVQYIGQL